MLPAPGAAWRRVPSAGAAAGAALAVQQLRAPMQQAILGTQANKPAPTARLNTAVPVCPCAGTQAPSDSAQCTARRAAGGWTRRAPAARRGRAAGGRWGQESWMGSRKLFAAPRCLRSGEWGRAVGRQRSGGVPAAQRQPMAAQSAWAGPVVPRSAPSTPRLAGSQPIKMAVPLCFLRVLPQPIGCMLGTGQKAPFNMVMH